MNKRTVFFALAASILASCAAPERAEPPKPVVTSQVQGIHPCSENEVKTVEALFTTWDKALRADRTGDAVVALYGKDATLLPTVQVGPYRNNGEIQRYFKDKFLPNKPVGTILDGKRTIVCGDGVLIDAGLYDFKYASGTLVHARYTFIYGQRDGQWRIVHHHSSQYP